MWSRRRSDFFTRRIVTARQFIRVGNRNDGLLEPRTMPRRVGPYTWSLMASPGTSLLVSISLVGVGGALGSIARYAVNRGAIELFGARFPAGTLSANLIGCTLAGILLFFISARDTPSPHMRLLLMTGFLGGLTTFSAFGYETVLLFQQDNSGRALMNVAANVGLSLAAVWLGFAGARAAA